MTLTVHDVFLSFTDRIAARALRDGLRRCGLDVWMDESLPTASGITAGVEEHLNRSKVMLILYSKSYPRRPACQAELTAAYLAGEREGDPLRRIVVINPEADADHLQPVRLADAVFTRSPQPGDDRATASLAAVLAAKAAALDGPFGTARFTDRPRWYPDGLAGDPFFVGRLAERWALHTALHSVDFPMVKAAAGGPVVALTGLPGSGKSALAAAYGWHFGHAFPGGVFRLGLSGATAENVLARYGAEMHQIAVSLSLPGTAGAGPAELTAAVADHLHAAGRNALWIVDDVPDDVDPETLGRLLLPAGPVVRTILISRRDVFGGIVPVHELGPMSPEDAITLLHRSREPDDDGADDLAAERVAERLGRHALSLRVAAAQLADRPGLRSFAEHLDRLDSDPETLDRAVRLVGAAFHGLGAGAQLVLRVAALLAVAPVPAGVLARIVAAVRPDADPGADLAELRRLQLAARTGDRWQVHAIVLDAVRRMPASDVPVDDLAAAAAGVLLAVEMSAQVAPHLAALADHRSLGPETTARLRRRLTGHYLEHGDPVSAARQWDRLLATGDPDGADLLAAADAHLRAGAFERAVELAASSPDGARVVAVALDGLGRFAEADRWWARVVSHPADVEGEIAYLRGRRLRGEMKPARARAEQLVKRLDGAGSDQLQAARLELATILLSTNEQQRARQIAQDVVDHYSRRGLPEHADAVAAQVVLAQAWLTLHLFELNPDPGRWETSARDLLESYERLRRSHGPLNVRTLTTDVEYGFALLCLGRPNDVQERLTATLDALRRRFPAGHHLVFRATFLLAQASSQLHRHDAALVAHQQAYDGLRRTLGPKHPETLAAQFALGVALILTTSRRRGIAMIAQVLPAAHEAVGLKTDLFAQSLIATLLLPLLPRFVMRLLARS